MHRAVTSAPQEIDDHWWPPLSAGELGSRYEAHTVDHLGPAYLPERISLTYAGRALEVTAGDHYVSLGRGPRAVAAQGRRARLRHRPARRARGGAAGASRRDAGRGGDQPRQRRRAHRPLSPDPLDSIFGGRIEVRLWERLTIATQGAAVFYRLNRIVLPQESDDRVLLGGFSLEVSRLAGLVDGYLEYARAERLITDRSPRGTPCTAPSPSTGAT